MKYKTSKFMSVFLAVMLIVTALPGLAVSAANDAPSLAAEPATWTGSNGSAEKEGKPDELLNWITAELDADGNAIITSFKYVQGAQGSPTKITIPSYLQTGTAEQSNVQKHPVVEIADNVFASCELTEIKFAGDDTDPCKISKIGARAFASNAFESIELPDSVTELGFACLTGNSTALTTVKLPANLKAIPENCFYNCNKLANVTLPTTADFTEIGPRAFYECDAMRYIKIPNSVKKIGVQAFSNISEFDEKSGKVHLFIDCSDFEDPSDLPGAPWGNENGYVHWDPNSAAYDNDSPFVIGKDGKIYGLKSNVSYDTSLHESNEYKNDKNDYRYYVAQALNGGGGATPAPATATPASTPTPTPGGSTGGDATSETQNFESGTLPAGFTFSSDITTDTIGTEESPVTFEYNGKSYKFSKYIDFKNNSYLEFTATGAGNLVIFTEKGKKFNHYEDDAKGSSISAGDNGIATLAITSGKKYKIEKNNPAKVYGILLDYTAAAAAQGLDEPSLTSADNSVELAADSPYDYIGTINKKESDIGEGGRLVINVPAEVDDGKGGKIQIKGIGAGAFGSHPANYVMNSVDFSALKGVMTEIPDNAFWEARDLVSVTIPEGVEKIGVFAFRQCQNNLKTVTLPSTIKTVEYWAFRQCLELSEVTFNYQGEDGVDHSQADQPDAVLSNIGSGAFSRCEKLANIYIKGARRENIYGVVTSGDTVVDETGINSHPYGAYNASIHYKDKTDAPYTVTDTTGDWKFNRETGDIVSYLGKSMVGESATLEIPTELKYTDSSGADQTVKITGIGQPEENKPILDDNETLNSASPKPDKSKNSYGIGKLVIPSGIININNSAFYGYYVGEIDFQDPDTVKNIAYRAFACAPDGEGYVKKFDLKNLILPSSIETIEDVAFEGRVLSQDKKENIKDSNAQNDISVGVLEIPKTAKSISNSAFHRAEGVGKIIIDQYYYNETDEKYPHSPELVSAASPFGFDLPQELIDGNVQIVTEYMDSGLPVFSDYKRDAENPTAPRNKIEARSTSTADPATGYSNENSAVINIGAIMQDKGTQITLLEYTPNGKKVEPDSTAINTDWWAENAQIENENKQETGNIYEVGRPYTIDLVNILGNGVATFHAKYVPTGSSIETGLKDAYRNVTVNIFHDQKYDGNDATSGTAPIADDNKGGNGDKNEFVESYGVPIEGKGDLEKAGAVFIGWYVVEGADGTTTAPDNIKDLIGTKEQQDGLENDGNFIKFIDDQGKALENPDIKLAMGKSDRTLYAVWAVDQDSNGIPDYLEAQETEAPEVPSEAPSAEPSESPSAEPSNTPKPTEAPTPEPTDTPTAEPEESASAAPSESPSAEPSEAPSTEPTTEPGHGGEPSAEPSEAPSAEPTESPSAEPSNTPEPTSEPTKAPQPPVTTDTPTPTEAPVTTAPATEAPTAAPATQAPATEAPATEAPTTAPATQAPATDTPTPEATDTPTPEPSEEPSAEPSEAPSAEPGEAPSAEPSEAPSAEPTKAPQPPVTTDTPTPTEAPSTQAPATETPAAETPTPEPTNKPLPPAATDTPAPAATDTPAPAATDTPAPAETLAPTVEPQPTEEPTALPGAYKLVYDPNGGTGDVPVDANDYVTGNTAALADKSTVTLEKFGAKFIGWSLEPVTGLVTNADEEEAANIITSVEFKDSDITVYAVWAVDKLGPGGGNGTNATPEPGASSSPEDAVNPDNIPDYKEVIYNLNYDTDEAPPVDGNEYSKGQEVHVTDAVPKRSGYTFLGWSEDPNATTAQYSPNDVFTMPGTGEILYAVWRPRNSGGGGGGFSSNWGTGTQPTPVPPQSGPSSEPAPPQLNTQDHFAYIVGYPEGDVRPENNIARDEAATIFFRMLTDESRAAYWSQSNVYTDVTPDLWSNNAISTMSNAGILTGYPDGSFMPTENITRAEFAAIAARFDDGEGGTPRTFGDIAGHWAEQYIERAAAKGWINGYEDGTFRPDQYITRAEAITLVNNILNRHVDTAGLHRDMITFTDNSDTGAWYYTAIQEAANSHNYERAEGEANETWTEITPPRNWADLEKGSSTASAAGTEPSVYEQ